MQEFLSSMFTHMGYNAETSILRVRFTRGAEYDYRNVPDKLWALFANIDGTNRRLVTEGMPEAQISVGRVFYYTIQCNPRDYPFTEVPKDEGHNGNGSKDQDQSGSSQVPPGN